MRRILVGVDGTDESRRAAHQAANMAQSEGKELVFAHVLPADKGGAFSAQDQIRRRETALKSGIDELAVREARADVRVHTRFIDGEDAAAGLAQAAEEDERIDLVVVGHRTRSPLTRALQGSVADRLVQICAKPVLVVH